MRYCLRFLGQRLTSRNLDRQVAAFRVRIAVVDDFAALGSSTTKVAGWVGPRKDRSAPHANCATEPCRCIRFGLGRRATGVQNIGAGSGGGVATSRVNLQATPQANPDRVRACRQRSPELAHRWRLRYVWHPERLLCERRRLGFAGR